MHRPVSNSPLPGFPQKISALPPTVKMELAGVLDNGLWRDLAKQMNLSLETIQQLEREMQRDDVCATTLLLNEYVRRNQDATVDNVYIFLGKLELQKPMMILKDYVNPPLISLIPNLSQEHKARLIADAKRRALGLDGGNSHQLYPSPVHPPNDHPSQLVLPGRSRAIGDQTWTPQPRMPPAPSTMPVTAAHHDQSVPPQRNGGFVQSPGMEYQDLFSRPLVQPIADTQPHPAPRLENSEVQPSEGPPPPTVGNGLRPPAPPSSIRQPRQTPSNSQASNEQDSSEEDAAALEKIRVRQQTDPAVPSAPAEDIGSLPHLSNSTTPMPGASFHPLDEQPRPRSRITPIAGTQYNGSFRVSGGGCLRPEGGEDQSGGGIPVPTLPVPQLPPRRQPTMNGDASNRPSAFPEWSPSDGPIPPNVPVMSSMLSDGSDGPLPNPPPPYTELPIDGHRTWQPDQTSPSPSREEMGEVCEFDPSPSLGGMAGGGNSGMVFEYAVLKEATNNFSNDRVHMLGEGGYGTVHRATIKASNCIVKRFFPKQKEEALFEGIQTLTIEQYQRELETLSFYRHRNILPLIGYSQDGPQLCLVYEYMPFGSLSTWLFGVPGQRRYRGGLTGTERIRIALGTAKALYFLHEARPGQPAIHCNVKSSNILLDEHMSPHLADFGHVRQKSALSSGGEGRTRIHTGSKYMARSGAYTDPDLHIDNSKVSPKVDVYSLGVVMLEMLTGKEASNPDDPDGDDLITDMQEPLDCAKEAPDLLLNWVSPNFRDVTADCCVEFAVIIANCLQLQRKHRSTSQEVVQRLSVLTSMHLSSQMN